MTMTKEQEAILLRAEEQMKRNAVNPTTNQPGDVPAFQPVGVSGYDPQSGEVNPNDSTLGKAGSFVNGAVDLPVLGPAMKAGAAGGAALLTKGIDTLTGLPSSDTLAERYAAMRDMQESSMATNPKSAMAGRVAGTLLTGRG